MNDKLYQKVKKLGLDPEHVAEVGVYLPETSNILGFIKDGCRADLIEPDPLCVVRIEDMFKHFPNVRVHPFAVFDKRTTLDLYRTNASTFVASLPSSPALVNDRYKPKEKDLFHAEAKLMSDLDDGTIDLLSIDTEGCEWYVLQTLRSRPAVISLETHGKKYRNPFYREIGLWMKNNKYKLWYMDRSDSVFIKKDIPVGFLSRFF
jgi:FkbM family methyltransferase